MGTVTAQKMALNCTGYILNRYNELSSCMRSSEAELSRCANAHDVAVKSWCDEGAKPASLQNLLQSGLAYESTAQQLASAIESASKIHVEFIKLLKEYKELLSQTLGVVERMKQEDVQQTDRKTESIGLWSSLANEKKLIFRTPTASRGKLWSRILLLVESVCGPIHGRFKLQDMSGNEMKAEPNTNISPGHYALEPVDGKAELVFLEKKCGIVPKGPVGTPLPESSPAILSSGSKRRSSNSEADAGRASRDTEGNTRCQNFIISVHQRDNHCVISKSSTGLEASHILAHSWWNKTTNRRAILPDTVVTTVQMLPDEIDDVRNGLLLRGDLAKAFDRGHISQQREDGHYRVVALSQAFENLDGVMLDENQRVRCDGSSWWKSSFPHPDLVAFHLRQSVFANLVAAGSYDSYHDSDLDGDDCCSVVGGEAPDLSDEDGSQVSERQTPCRGKRAEVTSSKSDTRGRSATIGSVPATWLADALSCAQTSPAQP